MIKASKTTDLDPVSIMTTFAQYGFRKTSMEDIARATGFSRQSIYKRFGSKEACYEAVLKEYMAGIYESIFATLENNENSPLNTLKKVFDIIGEDALEFSGTPHGPEVFEDALKLAASWPENWIDTYYSELANFILRKKLAANKQHSENLAYLLITASRGALINTPTKDEFSRDIHRILNTVFPGLT